MLHWLISKRTKGLIGEENRSFFIHARLLVLFIVMILFDLTITSVFLIQFTTKGSKINDIYVIAGFEVSTIFDVSIV
jgi:hypothetical protein